MANYKFEAVGAYVIITKSENGVDTISAIPSGVYSILPHISGDGRICLIKEVKTVNEKTYGSLSDEIQIYFSDITSPKGESVSETILLLTYLFSNETIKENNLGTGELSSNFEISANNALINIEGLLKEVVFLLQSISE